jgi:ubiquinone/menaquinone biosynthesis C-methylase UbiE
MNNSDSRITYEMTHKRSVANFFSRNTNYWKSVYETTPTSTDTFTNISMLKRKAAVIEMVDRYSCNQHLNILDVGCGPGVMLEAILSRGHIVRGIDLSEDMVREANARLGGTGSAHPLCVKGDIEALPFDDESMDVVLCLGVLPYLREEQNGINEISRVVRKGGLAVVVMPNLIKLGNLFDPYYYLCRSWQYLRYQLLATTNNGGQTVDSNVFGNNREFGIRRYTLAQIDRLFKESRLQKCEIKDVEYGPLTLWRKTFLPHAASIRISDFFGRLSRVNGFERVRMLSGQWVISYVKM